MMSVVASQIPFNHFCKLCEKVSTSGREKKKEHIHKFFSYFRNFISEIKKKQQNSAESFFPVLRLLLPQLDRDRGAYGIKEVLLAKLYIRILGLNKEGQDARKLLNYRTQKSGSVQAGDFAEVAYFVLKNRCPEDGTMTVYDVNQKLDDLALHHANRSPGDVEKDLTHMLRNMSALEQKWLIRVLMKDVRLGLGQNSLLGMFHLDAKDLYDVSNNLLKVCQMLPDPSVRLHEVEISLFEPFRPMLADRGIIPKVEKQMDNKSFFIETKHDGERLQLHKKGRQYRYFSRNGFDFTKSYGGDADIGSFTPHIHTLFRSDVNECILDGEMVGWNKEGQYIGSKGENFDVKNLSVDDDYQPCLCVFDILYLNGCVLTNRPLRERLQILEGVFTPIQGRIGYTTRTEAVTRKEVISALNDAIDNREEGIVLKNPDSVYKPATRKGGWLKIKPEYTDSLMDQLDLIIMGGYFGDGRRRGLISHFLVGLAVAPEKEGETPTVFHSVGRIGSGYSMQELSELLHKMKPHWKKRKPDSPLPGGLAWTREKPDLWLDPKNSYIVQVKAAEIVESDMYKVGYTLRFPRVEKVRYDKSWFDCMTTQEFHQIRQESSGKLASRHLEEGEEDVPVKRRRVVRAEQPVLLATHYQSADISDIRTESKIFGGKEFCVVNGPESHTKQDLEKLIVKHGGTIIQNPGPNTYCVIAAKVNLRVQNISKTVIYDIVSASWLLRCTAAGSLQSWTPQDMIHTSEKTAAKFSCDYDEFGDSYTEDATVDSLKHVFSSMDKKGTTHRITHEEIAELEQQFFPNSPLGLFRLCNAYFDRYAEVGDSTTSIHPSDLEVVELQLRFRGGKISEEMNQNVSHVIVSQSDMSRLSVIREINRQRKAKFHIVDKSWVEECVKVNKILAERQFEPK